MGLMEVVGLIYITALCAVLADEDVTSTLKDFFPTSALPTEIYTIPATADAVFNDTSPTNEVATETQTVYELPVPSLHLISPWWDFFPFEKAQFECRVNDGSDWTFTWYKNGNLLDDAESNVSSDQATLTITPASQSDSGMYSCKVHHKDKGQSTDSNPVQLKVYANKPKPTLALKPQLQEMFPGESVTFQCEIKTSIGWDYVWYHNDVQIQGSFKDSHQIVSLALSHSGRYHCKAKRGQSPFYTEQSDTSTLQVSEPPTPTMRLLSSWSDVFQKESVVLTCDVGSSSWTFTWYRNGMKVQADPTLVLSPSGSHLNILAASRVHQGRYACKAQLESRSVNSALSNSIDVTVEESIPKPSLTKDSSFNPMYVGENVTFTCTIRKGSDWVYHWFKDGKELVHTAKTLRLHLRPQDGGAYWCKGTRDSQTSTDISDTMTLVVLEIPLPSLTRSTQWADVFPTESVTLTCATSGGSSDWTYTWRRDDRINPSGDAVSFGPDGATLSIGSASVSHQGQYRCLGKLKGRSVNSGWTSGMILRVYDKKPVVKIRQDPDYPVMHTGDFVSYNCHINQSSGWEYVWYQDDTRLSVSGNNYTIQSALKTNSGSYKCEAIRGKSPRIFKTEQSQALRIQIKVRPSANIDVLTGWSEVFSTDSLVLKCGVKHSKDTWNYQWFMEGQRIANTSSDRYTVTPQNDPQQSQYVCRGVRNGQPSYSKDSESLATKNLLLKRRVLLSISGCMAFGIVVVFLCCIGLRVTRKKKDDEDGPEEADLFLTMAQLKNRDDTPCPLVDYITDAEVKIPAKDGADIISSEPTTDVTSQDDLVVATERSEAPSAEEAALVSFQR
ncbi:B-cell receptor CD22 isoform X2 [Syngnathus scovelli]|uniref:B-cell receptor CD22 isoform X2 n=1 Tax=Syngnathus scovelli TaxID=161590 RepID=UPI002110E685|nr:B-cell receptor CD22 isoform X2 [Syngnathus scovelli]